MFNLPSDLERRGGTACSQSHGTDVDTPENAIRTEGRATCTLPLPYCHQAGSPGAASISPPVLLPTHHPVYGPCWGKQSQPPRIQADRILENPGQNSSR